jgi:hypothetical protein
MPRKLDEAIHIVNSKAKDEFEEAWENVTNKQSEDNYNTHIWGSTIEDRRDPVDLDVIFEYKTEHIGTNKENSIEGWVKNAVHISEFSYLDPMVIHVSELSSVISQSRVSS